MKYRAFATDYDGTLASRGKVAEETLEALEGLKTAGTTLLLVTGRELDDLQSVFPGHALFDSVVAENGALLYRPGSRETTPLAERPPEILLRQLRERAVEFSAGRVIVATTRTFERQVREVLGRLSLDRVIIFNKEALMLLPPGVDKVSGLHAALAEYGVEWAETVGVGDAENDVEFLSRCGYAVATANALQPVRRVADFTAGAENGAGVREAILRMRRLNGE